jgi:plasmid stabilization system protein ParE
MEEGITRKKISVSSRFYESNAQVYSQGLYLFGSFQAERYNRQIDMVLDTLPDCYTAYPECRHLATKSRMYRNIILDAHPIVYRITDGRVEVPDILHSASSTGKIRAARNIRL